MHYLSPSRFLLFSLLWLAAPRRAAAQTPPSLRAELVRLEQSAALRHAAWGVAIQRVDDGALLAAHQPDQALTTASTLKLLTTGAAMARLGPTFTYQTRLEAVGTLGADGTLRGYLCLRGSGDPALGSTRFAGYPDAPALLQRWVAAVRRAGILRIEGPVVGDNGTFDDALPDGWPWQDIGNYYGAAAAGLNFGENQYQLYFAPGRAVGEGARVVGTNPPQPDLQFDNQVQTGAVGSGDQAYIYGAPRTGYRLLRGTVPAGVPSFAIRGAVADPALGTARQLTEALAAAGVVVAQAPARRVPDGAANDVVQVLDTYRSPPLRELVRVTNQQSLNLYAEALLKTLGAQAEGEGTTAAGLRALQQYWQDQGLLASGCHLTDGSGLSPTNALTPAHLATACRQLARAPFADDFRNTLAVAGVSGTLKNFGKGTVAQGQVWGKSGSSTRVLAYAGYVQTRRGERYAFALMANHYDGPVGDLRQLFERLLALVAAME